MEMKYMDKEPLFYYYKENQIKRTYDDERMQGTHYVMWSGGVDSTCLLYELLDLYGASHVVAISYIYPWLDHCKRESEKKYREAFKAKMKLKGDKYSEFSHIEITISEERLQGHSIAANQNQLGFPQAVAWMLSVPLYAKEHNYIYTGAIREDDLCYSLEAYREMFVNISKVLNKHLILREPYLLLHKYQIIEKAMDYGFYDETWFCECPRSINVPCCRCNPCLTHMRALSTLAGHYVDGPIDERIRLKAVDELHTLEEFRKHGLDTKLDNVRYGHCDCDYDEQANTVNLTDAGM